MSSDDLAGCSIERISIASPGMGRSIRVAVLLPPGYQAGTAALPVLYALHGAGAPYDTWSAMPTLHRGLGDHPMIVVCFDGDAGSWYLDATLPQTGHLREADRSGPVAPARSLFTTFFFDECMPAIEARYRTDPSRRMLTGFSMGGFGALHYLLTRPQAFIAVSALSGAFLPMAEPDAKAVARLAPLIGGYAEAPGRYRALDLYARVAACRAAGVALPPILLHHGDRDVVPITDDDSRIELDLRVFGRAFHACLVGHGYEARLVETPGQHNWPFWRDAGAGVIAFHGAAMRASRPV